MKSRKSNPADEAFFNILHTHSSKQWAGAQRIYTKKLFTRAAQEVPAYKHFLTNNKHRTKTIGSDTEWLTVPITSKDSYLRTHVWKDLFWKGTLDRPHMLTSTSGSTGEPFYFARSQAVNTQSSFVHELFLRSSSLSARKPTLVIVCFGMGVWIGGLITAEAFELMEKRGYPLGVITPGLNKREIFKALKKIAPAYEQIILAGYPPFIKDVLDEAESHNISLTKYSVALLFAAEAFTETFRDYVAKKAGVKNIFTDTMNIYGSADLGTMAFETPLSILVRRLAVKKPSLFVDLFGSIEKTPTLAQFIPNYVSFEDHQGELLVTGDSAMPLIRYSIGDHGGVRTHDDIVKIFQKHGIHLSKEITKAGITKTITALPFVYVYERVDLSTTLYGLQIYPETIRETLLQKAFAQSCTGRCTIITKFDDAQNQYLEVNVEQKSGASVGKMLAAKLASEIVRNLKLKNAEYRELANHLGNRSLPRLVFWPHEDPLYFRPDIKQRWVIKSAS